MKNNVRIGYGALLVCLTTLASSVTASEGDMDRDALNMFRRGEALLRDRQEERAVSVFEGILLNFPRSQVRHQAALALARHLIDKRNFEQALKHLGETLAADDVEDNLMAEALLLTGMSYYEQNDNARALTFLRRVTENYPWSAHSNEAYYYIGLCHFSAQRWTRAVEAFRMVGTSVEPSPDARNLAEAGQRYMIRVEDRDLQVLALDGKDVDVVVQTSSGDRETVALSSFDREGTTYLGSIRTESGPPVPGDGILQFKGTDEVQVTYLDRNTQDGARNQERNARSRLVSTATAGFMDGAYREYVQGVFAAQRTFIQVRDFDKSVSNEPDQVTIRLYSQYRPSEQELADRGILVDPEDGPHYVLHDEKQVTLTETGPHTGVFRGVIIIDEVESKEHVRPNAPNLQAVDGDIIFFDYEDKRHIASLDAPRTVTSQAAFLTGDIPDVWVAQREVQDPNLRARKNNIEAAFYLRLGEVFRNVGLVDRVAQRVAIGLEKVNDVIRQSLRVNIDRSQIEEAYRLKWELQVLNGDLQEAISTCRTFMSLYPESQLADQALMQIAKASMEAGDRQQAFQLFQGILQLNTTTDLKGEAQYFIALLLEQEATARAAVGQQAQMGQAIAAFQRVSDQFPGSPFAGEALGKVIDFYIGQREFDRANEQLERVFVDYPDAPFLDEMLLKWGVVLVRMNRHADARDRLQQLLRDYPNSPSAAQARPLMDRIATMQSR